MLSEYYRINNNFDKQKGRHAKSLKYFHEMGLSDEDIEKEFVIIESKEYGDTDS
jgi:hypothetical protein